MVKNPPANAGDTGLIPGLGRSPGEGNGNPIPSSILSWIIPWTEEPGRLQSRGLQGVRYNLATKQQTIKNSELLMSQKQSRTMVLLSVTLL